MNLDPSSKYYSDHRSVLRTDEEKGTDGEVHKLGDVGRCTDVAPRTYRDALINGGH